jgi:hypothetical protein
VSTIFQLNPRTLPALEPGENEIVYEPGTPEVRCVLPVRAARFDDFAFASRNARYAEENGQGFIVPAGAGEAAIVFELAGDLTGFDAGGRFLDLRGGLAPDKLTAEVRKTAVRLPAGAPRASLEWSLRPDGGFQTLWSYEEKLDWRDGDPVDRLLRWPEVDERVRSLPAGTNTVYVRYRLEGMALDDIRLAAISRAAAAASPLEITHLWSEAGTPRRHTERVSGPRRYKVRAGTDVVNESIILSCPR